MIHTKFKTEIIQDPFAMINNSSKNEEAITAGGDDR